MFDFNETLFVYVIVRVKSSSGLPFWSELAQADLNSDHSSYLGLKMGLNFLQKSDMKNIYSK